MADVAYTRSEMLPQQDPPASSVGAIGWARANLFSGVFNSLLTILSILAIAYILRFLLGWTFSPTWNAYSLSECREILAVMGREGHVAGACWGVIRDRWIQLLFGFYPSELYWRPILAFILLLVALAPVLFSSAPKKLLWFTAVFPFIFPWMMWGGDIWDPILVMLGVVLAYFVYRAVSRVMGQLAGLIGAVLAAVLWWLIGVSLVGGALTSTFAAIKSDGVKAEQQAQIEELTPRVQTLEAELAEKAAALATLEEGKDEILARYQALTEGDDHHGERTEEHEAIESEFRAFINQLAGPRAEVAAINTRILKANTALSEAESLLRSIEDLPNKREELTRLEEEAAAARAALPDTVSSLYDVSDVEEDTPRADVQALEAVLSLEASIISTETAIADTESKVGLVGLKPVISRNFGGFMLSILIGVVAIACSLPLGIVLALGRQSDLLIVKYLCVGFIEFVRGVPLITLLFVASTLLNLFLPPGTTFDIILRVLIMVTLFAAAYMAEVIRGGLAALPKGQYEGADSLGLDYWQAQRLIIMPQALKISIPGIVSNFIGIFKDSVLVSIIGLLDPLGLSNAIRADAAWNGIVWEIYGFIALLFFIFCFSMSRYSMYLERKLKTDHH